MFIRDMIDRIITETGEFMLDPSDLEIDIPRFVRLVNGVLGTYSRYCPRSYKFNLSFYDKTEWIFSQDFRNPLTAEVLGIPDWVSAAVPIQSQASIAPYLPQYALGRSSILPFGTGSMDLIDKTPIPFEYRKPRLFVPYTGLWDVSVNYKHVVTGKGKDQEVLSVDEHSDIFFELLQAKFLIALGRNRRAFTLQPLELTMDAAELVSEGQTQWDKAFENLTTNKHQFYKAWE